MIYLVIAILNIVAGFGYICLCCLELWNDEAEEIQFEIENDEETVIF